MPNEKRGILSTLSTYVHMLINAGMIYVAYFITCYFNDSPPAYPYEIKVFIGVITIIVSESFIAQIITKSTSTIDYRPTKQVKSIWGTKMVSLAILLLIAVLFAPEGSLVFYSLWAAVYTLVSASALGIVCRIKYAILRLLRKGQYYLKRTLIVGDNTTSVKEYISQVASNPGSGVMILGFIGDKIEPDVGCEKLGSFKDFIKVLDRYHPTDVVFSMESYDKRHLIKLVNICEDRCIKVYFLPVTYGFLKDINQIEQIGNVPLVNLHTNPLSSLGNAFIKRAIDLIGSLVLIILSAPLMIVVAIIIKLTSPGPVFFKQTRIGKMGKPFTMLKFRSMPVDIATAEEWTIEGDERTTKFGSFMRRTSIDEIPQFFNVLLGDMSLVGPRPEIPRFVDEFRETIPLYMIKHYVKPGVTGLAQIYGLRGDTSVEERIHKDIAYIESWSVWLDLSIILKTPFKAFNKYEKYVESVNGEKETGTLRLLWEKLGFKNPSPTRVVKPNQKILYAASTAEHLRKFHTPYIEELRTDGHTVMTMGGGEGVDFNIPFVKKIFSKENKLLRKDIKEIVKKEEFDLIILNTSLAAYHIRRAIPNKSRPRIINIVHGYLFSESEIKLKARFKRRMLIVAERLLRRKTDAVLTMNDEDMRIATKNGFALGPVIPIFGMGVPFPIFREEIDSIREKMNCNDDFVILFAGELSKRKNQEFLIKALPRVKTKVPKARLWLLGDGDEKENLAALAETLGVSDSVTFFGNVDNPIDYMRDCDLYVSPARSEGLPFNVVEALGVGKTVLASKVKGHTDILGGGFGFLYELDDKWEFADKVLDIYEGHLSIPADVIWDGYRNFSDAIVFPDTYDKIKEAGWL